MNRNHPITVLISQHTQFSKACAQRFWIHTCMTVYTNRVDNSMNISIHLYICMTTYANQADNFTCISIHLYMCTTIYANQADNFTCISIHPVQQRCVAVLDIGYLRLVGYD